MMDHFDFDPDAQASSAEHRILRWEKTQELRAGTYDAGASPTTGFAALTDQGAAGWSGPAAMDGWHEIDGAVSNDFHVI